MAVSLERDGKCKERQLGVFSISRFRKLIFVLIFGSRSHLSEGLKSSFEERMEKTQKEKAFKKLQRELKEEKEAEFTRFAARFG